MSTTAARDDLRKVIEGGIYEEYNAFILAQAVFLSTLDYAQGLNEGGFGELFGVVQGQCINAMILSLTRFSTRRMGTTDRGPYGLSLAFGSGTHLMVRALTSLRAAEKSDTMCR
jgi:hypothetical protein